MADGRGGKRRGAGRKPGGGVSPVKVLRTEARALLADIVGTARDPLLVAIAIATDVSKPDALRLEAALGACRFLHPVLSAAAVAHVPARPDAGALIDRLAERLGRMTAPAALTIDAMPSRVEPA